MKRMARLLIVALCLALTLGVFTFAACGNDDKTKPEKTCLVQVEGGSGGGYYFVNTNCTVVAQVPEGKQFIKWVSGETDLSPNAEYTFTVTKNIRLKAVFADDIADINAYTVNVRYGFGGGCFFNGTSVKITAGEYPGAIFTEWVATYKGADGNDVTESISTEPEFNLTVTKNINLEAHFEATKLATPNNENGEMFRIAGNGAYELDRNKNADGSKNSAFVEGVEFLLYNVYELKADTEDEFVLVGQAKVVPIGHIEGEYHHYMYDMDMTESTKVGLKGGTGNMYQDVPSAKDGIRKIMNIESGKKYYISVRAMGGEDTPIDSEESAKFAVQF